MRPDADETIVVPPASAKSAGAGAFATVEDVRLSGFPGFDEFDDSHALPLGFRLDEFEIIQVIGEGGFSIVYLAWDHSLERQVALKEYMPSSIAARSGQTRIGPQSERQRETFEAGLKSFVNEGRLLAQFDHRSLVKVFRFWQANGTAYIVMPFYRGRTLRDTVKTMPSPPDETWLRALLSPLMDALETIHFEKCYHRDIAPDNILLLESTGEPLLLDFGAARRVIGDMTQGLTVILKPGYAPVEQYADLPGMTQGAWTDIYALAAVMYWAMTGKPPLASTARMLSDTQPSLVDALGDRYSAPFLRALDRALAVHPDRRTQSIEALRRELEPGPAERDRTERTMADPVPPPRSTASGAVRGPESVPASTTRTRAAGSPATTISASGSRERTSLRRHRWIVASLAVAVSIVVGLWWLIERQSSEPRPMPVAADNGAASAPSTTAQVDRAAAVDRSVQRSTKPFRSVSEAVAMASVAADASVHVALTPVAPPGRDGSRKLAFDVASDVPGYLYLFAFDESRGELLALSASRSLREVPIEAHVPRSISFDRWDRETSDPVGRRILAIVSVSPRAFDAGDWHRRGDVRAYDTTIGVQRPPFWGAATCPDAGRPCSPRFGVAVAVPWTLGKVDSPGQPVPARPVDSVVAPRAPETSRPNAPDRKRSAECEAAQERVALGESSASLLGKCP